VASEKDPREPYVLVGMYESLYLKKYGKKPKLNKFGAKYAMKDVIDSLESFDRAKEVLIYYFKTNKIGHPLNFFFNNFDRIDSSMIAMEKDVENRRMLLRATKKLVEGGE
jgi:hypothetical protein